MPNPIIPTIGRIVWYVHPHNGNIYAALVSAVFNANEVSLHVFVPSHDTPVEYISVSTYKDPDGDTLGYLGTWHWMPYQRGQAAKADELEKKLAPTGCVAVTLGRVGYEAYAGHTGWESLVTGASLPLWENVSEPIRTAWETAAAAIVRYKA